MGLQRRYRPSAGFWLGARGVPFLADVIFAHAQCAHNISFVSESRSNAEDECYFANVRMCQAFVSVTQVLDLHAHQSGGGRDLVGEVGLVIGLYAIVT